MVPRQLYHPSSPSSAAAVKPVSRGTDSTSTLLLPRAGRRAVPGTMELAWPRESPGYQQLVLRTNRHIVTHNYDSNELSLHTPTGGAPQPDDLVFNAERPRSSRDNVYGCPLCGRPWPNMPHRRNSFTRTPRWDDSALDEDVIMRPHYFRLLSETTLPQDDGSRVREGDRNEGYYARFFVELGKLGRGARGSVYLCEHVLHGHVLGKYAVKKIPVGEHTDTLLRSLNEVHLMEELVHPNVIHYKHAWVEMAQTSAFTPPVPTLFVLMMAANGGSLADWIAARAGEASAGDAMGGHETMVSMKSARVERLKNEFRQRRADAMRTDAGVSSRIGVHFLKEEEVVQLMMDIVRGLAFLHSHDVLHLDLKPGNVLLHWDDDALLPTAMLGDFGSSLHAQAKARTTRTGHTGTLEYMAPEVLFQQEGRLVELSSKADIWSLGVLFHLLLFFELPYTQVDDIDQLRAEIAAFTDLAANIEARGLTKRYRRVHPVLTALLRDMLQVNPYERPSSSTILQVLENYASTPRDAPAWSLRTPLGGVLARVPRAQSPIPSTTLVSPSPPHHPRASPQAPLGRALYTLALAFSQVLMFEHSCWASRRNLWLKSLLTLVSMVEVAWRYVRLLTQRCSCTVAVARSVDGAGCGVDGCRGRRGGTALRCYLTTL